MFNPLKDANRGAITLTDAPLKRVLAAVAFSPIMRIVETSGAGIAGFQDLVRKEYPQVKLEVEHALQLQLDEAGNTMQPITIQTPVWRFTDSKAQWSVSLTRESLSLDTMCHYAGREDFVGRLKRLIVAAREAFEPAQATRIGVRYVNMDDGPWLTKAHARLKPDFAPFSGVQFDDELQTLNSTAQFIVPEGKLVARYGVLQPGAVWDPNLGMPQNKRAWFLDLDCFNEEHRDFDAEALGALSSSLADRICCMFRWAIDPFLGEK